MLIIVYSDKRKHERVVMVQASSTAVQAARVSCWCLRWRSTGKSSAGNLAAGVASWEQSRNRQF